MLDKLQALEARYSELENRMADPAVLQDPDAYQQYSREHAELSRIVEVYQAYQKTTDDLSESRDLLDDKDPEIKALAQQDVEELTAEQERLEDELKRLLVPKDPNDNK